jgi:hypothetical protein
MSLSDAKKARAEAAFKRKEDQAHDGANAWAEYEARSRAIAENTNRLKALRLAKEAAATAQPQAKKRRDQLVPSHGSGENQICKTAHPSPQWPAQPPKIRDVKSS